MYSGNIDWSGYGDTYLILKLNGSASSVNNQPQTLTILCGHGKKFADVKTAIEDHRIENVKMFEF